MKPTRMVTSVLLLLVSFAPGRLSAGESRIELRRDDRKGRMQVLIDGQEALVYRYGPDEDLAHLYPIRSPFGQSMTIQHPEVYPHHRSFWFADKVRLGDGRTVGFYNALYSSEGGKTAPKPPFEDHVRHVDFLPVEASRNEMKTGMKLLWEMDGTTPVLDELRRMRIVALGNGEYLLDVTFRLTASYGDVTFESDATHYAWPYVRMNLRFSVESGGTITNSEGGANQEGTHNQFANWVDYSNTVDGQTSGLALFSHSDNAHPHRWLTRDYGTFGPRRIDAKSGNPFTLPRGESMSQRVGVLVHRGDVATGRVGARYEQYIQGDL